MTTINSVANRLWRNIIEQHPAINAPDDILTARFFQGLSFVGSVVGIFVWIVVFLGFPSFRINIDLYFYLVTIVAHFASYLLAKSGAIHRAIQLYIGASFVGLVFPPFFPTGSSAMVSFGFIPVLLTAIFYGLKRGIQMLTVVSIATIIMLFSLPYLLFSTYLFNYFFVLFGSLITLIFMNYRQQVEEARKAELLAINTQLRESQANLDRRVQSRTRDLRLAGDIARQITMELDRETLLTRIVERTAASFRLYQVAIFTSTHDDKTFHYEVGTNIDFHEKHIGKNFPFDEPGLVAQCFREESAILLNDVQTDTRYIHNEAFLEAKAELVLPMFFRNELIGVLDLQSDIVNRFTEEDVELLSSLSDQIAISIRNADLYEEQSKIADNLRQVDELKSQFLASMSHELRTPLNAIINFTDFTIRGLMGEVNERQKDALNKSLNSARHLLALINDVLDITKIESGMMQLFIEENVDLQPEIDAVLTLIQPMIDDKPVEVVTDIKHPLPKLMGDRRRLKQVMLNLLSNAAKFTEEGTITLEIKGINDHLILKVIDTGPGIPADKHDVIFEPFEQTESGIRHANGTGLGLPISKKLVEAHAGKLWVESEPDQGSTFFVQLPLRPPQFSVAGD